MELNDYYFGKSTVVLTGVYPGTYTSITTGVTTPVLPNLVKCFI